MLPLLLLLSTPAFACNQGDTVQKTEQDNKSEYCTVYAYCYGWTGQGNTWAYGYHQCNGRLISVVETKTCLSSAGTTYEESDVVSRGECRAL